jgi:hypothetical protein
MKLYFEKTFGRDSVEIPEGGAVVIEPRPTDVELEGDDELVSVWTGKRRGEFLEPFPGEKFLRGHCFAPKHLSSDPTPAALEPDPVVDGGLPWTRADAEQMSAIVDYHEGELAGDA